jgi:hypothetical protein
MLLIVPDHIQITEVDGKCVLLDCKKNYFYAVSKTGAELMDQLKATGNMKDAIKKISTDYQVSSGRVEKDMTIFVHQLIEKGLILEQ